MTLSVSREKIEFTKDEVALLVNKKANPRLAEIPEFQLHAGMTQFELVIKLPFVLDADIEINKFLLASQRNNTTPSDLLASINTLFAKLEVIKETDGNQLTKFRVEYDEDKETWER